MSSVCLLKYIWCLTVCVREPRSCKMSHPLLFSLGCVKFKTLFCVWPPLYLTVSLSCSNVLSVPGKKAWGMLCVLLTLHRPFCLALICSSSACDLCCWKQILVTSALQQSHTDKGKLPGQDYTVTHRPLLGFPKASLDSWCSAFTPKAETWSIFFRY